MTQAARFVGTDLRFVQLRTDPKSVPTTKIFGVWLLALAASTAVAHGCHTGGHGDADLLTRVVTAAGSPPAAASP
jgi:hypothetical protein